MLKSLLFIPLVGAALIALMPGRFIGALWAVALGTTAAAFGYTLWLYHQFDPAFAGIQFYQSSAWSPRLGSAFVLAIDGISLAMLLLGSLLCLIAVVASAGMRERAKAYYLLLLILEAALLGVFMARDWSLFYACWELTLIPLFFLISGWGGQNRRRAAFNYALYTLGGSLFLLAALLLLYDAVPGQAVFEMTLLRETGRVLPEQLQILLFLAFLIGFGVMLPIFPLHGWLPLAQVEAPSPVAILLSGVLLKMGAYGLVRVMSILPAAATALQGLLLVLALVSLVYGGILAWRQRDLKAMIAYSSVSHMGVVLLGLAALNSAGITGAVIQMVAHGLVAGALFLLIGLLYERTHTRDIADYSSLVRVMPRFAFFTVLALVAAIGLPGSAGFIAELHALIGGFQVWGGWIVFLSLAVLVSAAYALRTVGRLFTGPVSGRMQGLPDLTLTELTAAAALTGGSLLIGIYPTPALELIDSSVDRLTQLFL